MSNQRSDVHLLQQYYDEIGTHDVTKNYDNFNEKVPISITYIENIKITKYYSITNAIMYPSYSVDCVGRPLLNVANTIFSSPTATNILDPTRKVSQHIYVGQTTSPKGVAGRFTSHMKVGTKCMPSDLYKKISLITNNAMFAPMAFTFFNYKLGDITDLLFLESSLIKNIDLEKITNKTFYRGTTYKSVGATPIIGKCTVDSGKIDCASLYIWSVARETELPDRIFPSNYHNLMENMWSYTMQKYDIVVQCLMCEKHFPRFSRECALEDSGIHTGKYKLRAQ